MINLLNHLGAYVFFIIANGFVRFSHSFALQYNLLLYKLDFVDTDYILPYFDVCDALIIVEDKRFYNHKGIDVYSMMRAAKNTIVKRLEGASTIDQQLVRIITNQRTISLKRKFYEILLASLIHRKYSKLHILAAYMQLYPFSSGLGLRQLMAENSFKLPLSLHDKASIIARFKYPYLSKTTTRLFEMRLSVIKEKISKQLDKDSTTMRTFCRNQKSKLNQLLYET